MYQNFLNAAKAALQREFYSNKEMPTLKEEIVNK